MLTMMADPDCKEHAVVCSCGKMRLLLVVWSANQMIHRSGSGDGKRFHILTRFLLQ